MLRHSLLAAALAWNAIATAAPLDWDARDTTHPILGVVRLASLKRLAETTVDGATVYTRIFVSCQKDVRKVAIELANTLRPSDLAGLHAAAEPRLLCRRDAPGGAVEEPLLVNWEVNTRLGDVLGRGLAPFALRECSAIRVLQEVGLPQGSKQPVTRIELEIAPADPALESVFVACGERMAQRAAPPPAPVAAAPAATEAPWRSARVLSSGGRTNVRSAPRIDAPIVIQLAPGTRVRVQRAGGGWWRARAAEGAAFDGYIREDRLSLR